MKVNPGTSHREQGFTLVELLVAMAVMAEIMAVAYILFDVNTRVGRTQIQVADMQQNQRIAQHDLVRTTRMAGRGGLPQNLAIAVNNNVPANTDIVSDAASPGVVENTDILTVRGVFTSPIFQLQETPGGSNLALQMSGGNPVRGSITISNVTKDGIPQSLEVFSTMGNRPEALILVSSLDDSIFAIVEITTANVSGGTATVNFNIDQNQYKTIAPWPLALTSVSFAGIVEEYRYYVREDFAVTGDDTSEPAPKLSRARVYPGTDDVWDGDILNASVDVSDNILDLQVALAYDMGLAPNGTIDENLADPSSDEWRYNDDKDDANDATWQAGELFYARINTLARTDRPDRNFVSGAIVTIEDRDYSEPTLPTQALDVEDRMFRRRQVQTVVDLRNVG